MPSPDPEQYEEMVEDINRRGIQVPIDITEDGTILDGRTRWQIAIALGIQVVPVRVIDPPDPYDYMVLAAVSRRHLTKEQRATLFVMSPMWAKIREEAAERARSGVKDEDAKSSSKTAAEKIGVGKTTVDEASGLARKAPELAKAVAAGDLTIAEATAITKDPLLNRQVKEGEVTPKQAAKRLKTEDQLAKEHDLKRLRTHAPDLMEAVDKKQMSLRSALATLDEREAVLSDEQGGTTNGAGLPTKPIEEPNGSIPRQIHEAIQSLRQSSPRHARVWIPDVVKAMLSAGRPQPKGHDALVEFRDSLLESILLLTERFDSVEAALSALEAPADS